MLCEPDTATTGADPAITGYSVLMCGTVEVSARYPGEVWTRVVGDAIELTMGPTVTIPVTRNTTHAASFTDAGIRLVNWPLPNGARPGDTVTLQPWRRTYGTSPTESGV